MVSPVYAVQAWLAHLCDIGQLDSSREWAGVVIGAAEYDNGYFVDPTLGDAYAVDTDGRTEDVGSADDDDDWSLRQDVNGRLTTAFGRASPSAAVAVNVRTGAVKYEDRGGTEWGTARLIAEAFR